MVKIHSYEGKNKEEIIIKVEQELNITVTDYFYKEIEIPGKLFKSKKYKLEVVLKNDLIEYIRDYIKNISRYLNIEIISEINISDDTINIMLVTNNNSLLIGSNGRNLNALQHILRQYLRITLENFKFKLNLDISNYKKKKISNLEKEVKSIAREVIKTKLQVKLDPMNSYERRIIHTLITKYKNLETISEGEEPTRCIIIKYKNEDK